MRNDDQRRTRGIRGKILISACFACSALAVVTLSAQPPAVADTAAVERGQALLGNQCGFCHGANARGGSSGPDLTRSALVQNDEEGRQLRAFLVAGRPDKGMPAFDLPQAQVSDLAAFLHAAITANATRRLYKILDIVVGDAKAGEAYFSGAGGCRACHSPSADLKGIGARYEPSVLQGRLLLPRGRVAPAGAASTPPAPLYTDASAINATVTLPSGESATGGIVRMTDFEVTIYDTASGRQRSWIRNGEVPKVTVTDPLQAHVDHLTKWTDTNMHNMTAYLVGLK
jgi:cytochrome c oxidase cbb3-type subunit 3